MKTSSPAARQRKPAAKTQARPDAPAGPAESTPSSEPSDVVGTVDASAAAPVALIDAVVDGPSFAELGLAAPIVQAVAAAGYRAPTPIQRDAIPLAMSGRDVMGLAQTGTGKTAAFTLPLLQKMMRHENTSMSPARDAGIIGRT